MQAIPRTITVEPKAVPTGVQWQLCDVTGNQCGGEGHYPTISLPPKSGPYDFTVTIKNPIRGIHFAPMPNQPDSAYAALWVVKGPNAHPHQPGNGPDGQITNAKLVNPTTLTFTDLNNNNSANGQLSLSYRLNFVDNQNHEVKAIDPDIKNGGTGSHTVSASYVIGAAVISSLVAIALSALIARAIAKAEIQRAAQSTAVKPKLAERGTESGDIHRNG